jgi:hypothetical protein
MRHYTQLATLPGALRLHIARSDEYYAVVVVHVCAERTT